MKVLSKPTVRFSQKAYQQMFRLTNKCDIEISAMGIIATEEEKDDAGVGEDFYVTEFFPVKQLCSGTSTVLDDEALVDLTFDLREKGIKSEQIVVWWHSHVNMDTGHSGTDESQIEKFDFDSVCISVITNKKGDLNLRIDMMSPIRYSFEKCSYAVDQIDILPDGWAEDIIEKYVEKATFRAERISVTKAPAAKTKSWYTGSGYTRIGTGGQVYDTSWAMDDDTDWAMGGVHGAYDAAGKVEEVIEALDFPFELPELQKAYDGNDIGANDAMELYTKFYAQEISKEELLQELELVHGVDVEELVTPTKDDDGSDYEAYMAQEDEDEKKEELDD
jgi:hypothetical protein